MASAYPADFLGIASNEGRIAPGQRANFALLDEQLQVTTTWIDGRQDDDR
jgi:N-acetylglucosamine-6-phosphate deacetylase